MKNIIIYNRGSSGSRFRLILLVLMLISGLGRTQNLDRVEYFFNTDPGFGAGVSVPVTLPVADLDSFDFTVSTGGLDDGFHRLFVRAGDENGSWSHTRDKAFLKQTFVPGAVVVDAVEYFFDSDPGTGNGTAVPFDPDSLVSNLSFSVDISTIPPGFHDLFVRARDDQGQWSLTHMRSFLKITAAGLSSQVNAAEYFIDSDPGSGQGTPLVLPSPGNDVTVDFNIDLSGVGDGYHILFIRARDDYGRWSLTHMRAFLKVTNVVLTSQVSAAEYFFDADPGSGQGTPLVLPSPGNDVTVDFNIDLTSVPDGYHRLFVRVRDDHGRWSLANIRDFLKLNVTVQDLEITAMEYFFDSDPGLGQGTALNFAPANNITSFTHVIGIPQLEPGFHNLFLRSRDEQGHWSLTQFRPFLKQVFTVDETRITKAEYFIDTDPGFGQGYEVLVTPDTADAELSMLIDLDQIPAGFHRIFVRTQDDNGLWSHASFRTFYMKPLQTDSLPDLDYVEYFIDTDPGLGNGHPVPVAPVQQIPFLAFQLDLTNVAFGQHFLFVRVRDVNGRWSLSTRDTIFYYLDSLPTAVLAGPQGFCVNSTGTFQVTLTGTPPWTLVIDNGFETDTVSGILSSPYFFDVIPAAAGARTASVKKVMDVYYTGLYTGIPIEYEVYPLPGEAGTLYGPADLCMGSGASWYWIYGVTNAVSYNWSLPAGATIVSGYNGNSLLVDFSNVTQSGLITVTPANGCGTGQAASLLVNIHDNPVVHAGEDQFLDWDDTTVMAATVTGGTEPYSYYWSPWYYLDNPYIQNPQVIPSSTVTYNLYVADSYGCAGNDLVAIYVGMPPGTTITGNLNYDNVLLTPLNNSTVMVKQGNEVILSAPTGIDGEYSLQGIPSGTYSLSGTSDKSWGGVNATDALLVLQHFTENITLAGLRLDVADVNGSSNINSIDALMIARRYTEIIAGFPVGDWCSEQKTLYLEGTGMITENLRALVYGDVNASYIPGARVDREVGLEREGMIPVAEGQVVEVPLLAMQEIEAGAVSLSFHVPAGVEITGVRITNSVTAPVFHVKGDQLKIAWFSLDPLVVRPGEPLLWIGIRQESTGVGDWDILPGSSLANGLGQTLYPVTLAMPGILVEKSAFSLDGNDPNPCSDRTLVRFILPGEGTVDLLLFNTAGERVKGITGEKLAAGVHAVYLDVRDLPAGVYYYRLIFHGQDDTAAATRKLIISH